MELNPAPDRPIRLPDRALRRVPTSLLEVFELEATLDRIVGHGAPQLFVHRAGSSAQGHVDAVDDSAASRWNPRVESIVMACATVSATAATSRLWKRARRWPARSR